MPNFGPNMHVRYNEGFTYKPWRIQFCIVLQQSYLYTSLRIPFTKQIIRYFIECENRERVK